MTTAPVILPPFDEQSALRIADDERRIVVAPT